MKLLTTPKCEEVYCQHLDNSCDDISLDALLEKSVKVYMEQNCTTPKQLSMKTASSPIQR
jgi:hypothetical protein